jgi:hypothetical protein
MGESSPQGVVELAGVFDAHTEEADGAGDRGEVRVVQVGAVVDEAVAASDADDVCVVARGR